LRIRDVRLSWYVDRLFDGEQLRFARYGHGEWKTILGRRGAVAARGEHRQWPAARQPLLDSLGQPGITYGLQRDSLRRYSTAIPEGDWVDADVFHRAAIAGELFPLMQALRGRELVIVGGAYLREVQGALPYRRFVEVPERDCFAAREQAEEAVRQQARPGVVIVLCCSILAPVLVANIDEGAALIDFGSLFDVFVRPSRGYQRRMKPWTIARNLGEAPS
jgi:hypothetical protein